MKGQKQKIFFITSLSVLVVLGTFIGAAVLAEMNRKGFDEDFPQTQYSYATQSSSKEENTSSAVNDNSQPRQEENDESSSQAESSSGSMAEYVTAETGSYLKGTDRILIRSSDNGFVEGNILCGGITMDFSGQTVGNTLVATGTDNFNNTVEITLVFEENVINASSKPLIRYEESADYLELSGTFKK